MFVGFVGSVEPGERGRVVPVQVFERGGFVGTKNFVEGVLDLGADVDGGGEFLEYGFFGGCLRLGVRPEMVCGLDYGLMVFGREFAWLAGAEIVGSGIGRAPALAFRSTRSGGPLSVKPVRC